MKPKHKVSAHVVDEDDEPVAKPSGGSLATITLDVYATGVCKYVIIPHSGIVREKIKMLTGECKPKGIANRVLYAAGVKTGSAE